MADELNRILLVAITRLGDMLQASPLIAGLKAEHPNAKLTVAIEQNFAGICSGIPGIDEVYPIDLSMVCQSLYRGGEGIVDAYKYIDKVVEDLRANDFQRVINMSSSAYTALLLRMLNVKDMRGWVADEEGHRMILDPWAMLFSAFVYHSNRDFNNMNLVDIFRCSAGANEHPRSLQYRVTEADLRFAAQFCTDHQLTGTGPLICVQAGASQEKRQWAPAKIAATAKLLIEHFNARLIFTGSSSEQKIIDAVFASYNHPQMVSAVGKTNLGQLAALLKSSKLLVTGDTGTMHLAVAVGTPVIALFLASALGFETGPYSEGNIVVQPQVSCNPCNPNLPCGRPDCHDQVTPEMLCALVSMRLNLSTEQLLQTKMDATVADPRNAAVYVSTFDEDEFLQFKQINGNATRNGFAPQYYEGARAAYRSLWKHEFNGFPIKEPLGSVTPSMESEQMMAPIEQIMQLSREGQRLLKELVEVIGDPHKPARLLGEYANQLTEVDKLLEETGLSHGVFGALIRMYIMEKENLRGDDPLTLARATKGLYDTLIRRSQKFGELFKYHCTKYQEQIQ